MKYALIDTRRENRKPDPELRRLAMLVAMDYERRKNGLRPDRWHWADRMLLDQGWVVADPGEAVMFGVRVD